MLGMSPGFAFQATLTGTGAVNGCRYSLAKVDAGAIATDGSVTITCDGTLPAAAATAILKDVDPTTSLSCNYKSVDFAEDGALIVTCAKTPVCTLSADPAPAGGITANTPVTLTTNCTPLEGTTYIWSSNTSCTDTTKATCAVSPTTTTIYSVKGKNSDGEGSAVPVEVKVNSTATAAPVCTLNAPSTFALKDEVILTANCTPAATSFVWTGGACASVTTASCKDYPAGTTTYTVIAKNDKGENKYSVTVTPGTTPPPSNPTTISCSVSASPSTPIAPGTEVKLTASCTPGATSYVWTVGGCAVNTSSCTVTPMTTTSYSVTGSNATATATPKTVTVTVNGPATTAPVCTLNAPSTFALKDEVSLTANCTPDATSFVWTGGACASVTMASCKDYPSGTTAYTVIAKNDKGENKYSVTVTLSTNTPSSLCSLTATPSSVAVGESYTLVGTCGSSNVISAKWIGEGCTEETDSSCTVRSTKAGTFDYSVAFTLQAGVTSVGGVPLTATKTVTVTAVTSGNPVCELKATPALIVSGQPSELKATCTPPATSYDWTDAGCPDKTKDSCTVYPTDTKDYTVIGSNFSGGAGSPVKVTVTVKAADSPASSYQGLWWNPQESGWGISLTQHSDKIFAAIYTYDAAGQPTWYVMSDCPIKADNPGSCTGTIHKVTGGSVEPWKKPTNTDPAGTGKFTFTEATIGEFSYTLNGIHSEKAIEKFTFADNTKPFDVNVNYTNLWMTTGEDGWGVALTQDKGNIFAALYTYNLDGSPVWYWAMCSLTVTTAASSCEDVFAKRTGGVELTSSSSWPTAKLPDHEQGRVQFTFSSTTQGQMIFVPTSGKIVNKKITPFPF